MGGRLISFPIPDGTFDSLTVAPNGILPGTSFTLDTSNLAPGTYHYFCDFHPWMQGTLTVT
jgi:plastocyanin